MMDFQLYLQMRRVEIKERKQIDDILTKGGCCVICGYNDDPRVIEKHHIAGKHNSDLTVSVCPNCHKKLSMKQNGWDNKWTDSDNDMILKTHFLWVGIADILELQALVLRDKAYEIRGEADE